MKLKNKNKPNALHKCNRHMRVKLSGMKGSTAKEIHADAAGETFQHLQLHGVKLPIVRPTQEVGIAYQKKRGSDHYHGYFPGTRPEAKK